jgi:hypothetical protein
MAKLPGKFNPKDHSEMNTFDALPVDDYHCKVKTSELKDTKAKKEAAELGEKIKGRMISIQFEVMSGEFKGRQIFTNLNIENEKAVTEKMAYGELTSICNACGVGAIEDTDEIHGKELMLSLKIVAKTKKFPASNSITKYASLKGIKKPSSPDKKSESEKEDPAPKKKKPTVSFD